MQPVRHLDKPVQVAIIAEGMRERTGRRRPCDFGSKLHAQLFKPVGWLVGWLVGLMRERGGRDKQARTYLSAWCEMHFISSGGDDLCLAGGRHVGEEESAMSDKQGCCGRDAAPDVDVGRLCRDMT